MAKKIIIEYHGHGYIYDDDDVPCCSFCGTSAEDTTIHSGDYSGEHICESQGCCVEYMNQNILTNPFEKVEKEIDVCDSCKEEEDTTYDGMCMMCWEDLNEHIEEKTDE